MDDLGSILIAICGFSVLCLGLIAVVAFMTGRTILAPIFASLFQRDNALDDETAYEPRRTRRRKIGEKAKGASSFSAQTAGVDPFDAAVQRHRQKRGDTPARPATPLDPLGQQRSDNPSPFGSPGDRGRPSQNRPLRSGSGLRSNRDRERDPDEIHDYDDSIDDEESFF